MISGNFPEQTIVVFTDLSIVEWLGLTMVNEKKRKQ
jgi:hypothetical protein